MSNVINLFSVALRSILIFDNYDLKGRNNWSKYGNHKTSNGIESSSGSVIDNRY